MPMQKTYSNAQPLPLQTHLLPGLAGDARAVKGCVARGLVLSVDLHAGLPDQKVRHGRVAVLASEEEGRAVILVITTEETPTNRCSAAAVKEK